MHALLVEDDKAFARARDLPCREQSRYPADQQETVSHCIDYVTDARYVVPQRPPHVLVRRSCCEREARSHEEWDEIAAREESGAVGSNGSRKRSECGTVRVGPGIGLVQGLGRPHGRSRRQDP